MYIAIEYVSKNPTMQVVTRPPLPSPILKQIVGWLIHLKHNYDLHPTIEN